MFNQFEINAQPHSLPPSHCTWIFLSSGNCRAPSSANPVGGHASAATAPVGCPRGSPQPLRLRPPRQPWAAPSERPAPLCGAVTVMCKLSVSATRAGASRLRIRPWHTERARRCSPNARAYWTLTSGFPLPLLSALDAGERGMEMSLPSHPASAPGRLSTSQCGLRVKCSTNASHHQSESFHQPVR